MGLPFVRTSVLTKFPKGNGNLPNGNILVGRGKEINRDSLSSGEPKGNSPNRTLW